LPLCLSATATPLGSLFAVKVTSFAEGRIGYRERTRRNGRLEEIHSLDDRLDHDIDELLA